MDAALHAALVTELHALTPAEGMTASALEAVHFGRSHRTLPRMPVLYEPGIMAIVSGAKRAWLGEQAFTYDASNILVSTVPMPIESETVGASTESPLLAVKVRLDLGIAADLALAIEAGPDDAAEAESIVQVPFDDEFAGSLLRLLRALRSPVETRLFGASLQREVCYRVLTGPKGPALRAAIARRSHFGQIARALHRIHTDFHERLDVETLAREAHLSAAAFHAHFKTVTATSPIQYLKATRLHKARLLMVQDGVSASRASSRVGYESPSQFSREFKRLFGRTPVEELKLVHATYEQAQSARDRP